VISFQSSAAMWRASRAMHCTYNQTLTPTSTEYDVRVQCRHQYPFRHITWSHNIYGRFIQTKPCTAKLSTPMGGNKNTRYKYVEVHTTVSIQEYSSCKQYDRKFGDCLKYYLILSPRDPNKIRTHDALRTNVPTNRNVIKIKYVDQKTIFLQIHVIAVSKICSSRTSR
jgi:hypothetical protein